MIQGQGCYKIFTINQSKDCLNSSILNFTSGYFVSILVEACLKESKSKKERLRDQF